MITREKVNIITLVIFELGVEILAWGKMIFNLDHWRELVGCK